MIIIEQKSIIKADIGLICIHTQSHEVNLPTNFVCWHHSAFKNVYMSEAMNKKKCREYSKSNKLVC